jgi:mono/diheme cytochrome c family protein
MNVTSSFPVVSRIVVLCAGVAVSFVCHSFAGASEPSEGEKIFALKVRPILREKCYGCHSDLADELEGGFNLKSRDSMLEGGDAYGEASVVPGDAESSSMLAMVAREEEDYEMPPKEADKLSQEEVWAIRDWINADAPWPDEARVAEIYAEFAEGVTVKTSGGLKGQWTSRKYKLEDLWAFQPIQAEFSIDQSDAKSNPVDFLINRKLGELGMEAAPPADRVTLIRRATFDLLGLPPTPEEVAAFVNDRRTGRESFAALVDRLLESPHYGEQWARHWLDVVRYADSSGFANDWERPNAWRYRDYVVRAFNSDKPFDQFTLEQIAGDELHRLVTADGVRRDQVNAIHQAASEVHPSELLIAAGFLRMGPWEHTGMSVAKVTRQLFLDDITDSVGQVFLGQALQCCRCHDHKFDPIPTQDYYSIQSVFATTQFADIDAEWVPEENLSGMKEDFKYHQMRQKSNGTMLAELQRLQAKYEAEWFKEKGLPYQSKEEAKKAGVPEDQLPHKSLRTPQEFGRERIGRKWKTRFAWEFDRYKPLAFSVYNGKTRLAKNHTSRAIKPEDPLGAGAIEQSAILTGGDPFSPGERVNPGVLSAVPGAMQFEMTNEVTGRRTALASWIVSPENSLTSRVLVNRVWAFHFGRGIAGNPNNFGATGKKPTHPELLDWLAAQFVSGGWSIKNLHRVIMNSDAYRRSTIHADTKLLSATDPSGDSYATFRPRRLEAEEVRDAMLMVSGELNAALGGIPIRPDMNLEAALQPRMIMGTFAPSYVPNPLAKDRNRRSIYAHKTRGHRLPFMETFNQPGSEKSCELRDQSNITPQVFAMFNGQEANDRALALAARAVGEASDDAAVIDRLFQLLFSRQPRAEERSDVIGHWHHMTRLQEKLNPRPYKPPSEVVREAIDENTGKPFMFTEQLFVYEDYQPDLQPHDVDARTRGLADVCLALLNSNEFIYVY